MAVIDSGKIYSPLYSQQYDYSIHISENGKYLNEVLDSWRRESINELISLKGQCPDRKSFKAVLVKKNLHDYFWDWEEIVKPPQNYEKETLYLDACLNGTVVQGVLHAYFPEQSRVSAGEDIVYIDRLAVAPWNRQQKGNQKYFKGVGSLLILAVKDYSRSIGMNGNIGLHSLPAAEPFYRTFAMNDMGIDSAHENLRYFEN